MARNIFEELTSYRVKIEKDGKELINVPGILALPGALIAPKASIIGTVAASLLGCNIHLENAERTLMIAMSERKGSDDIRNSFAAKK